MILAVTGGTGFVGRRLIQLAVERGHKVRALARRPQEPRDGVEWIEGSLEDRDALEASGDRERCRDPCRRSDQRAGRRAASKRAM